MDLFQWTIFILEIIFIIGLIGFSIYAIKTAFKEKE